MRRSTPLLLLTQAPVNCNALGFTDGLRVATYWLQAHYPGWHGYAPMYTLDLLLGYETVDWYAAAWLDTDDATLHSQLYKDCAKFMSINIPSVLVLLVTGAVLVLAVLQVGLVFVQRLLQLAGVFVG